MNTALSLPAVAPVERQLNRAFTSIWAFALGCMTTVVMALSAFSLQVTVARLGGMLGAIFVLYALSCPRLRASREFTIYVIFFGYMLIQLLWTEDLVLAANTLVPALDCICVMFLFASLVTYYDRRFVLAGAVFGFTVSSIYFTLTQHFPFIRQGEFPYNAVANMYLFGMLITLLLGLHQRWKALYFGLALVFELHIIASTSIKVNLGVLLGIGAAGLMYFAYMARLFWRYLPLFALCVAGLVYAVFSNEGLMATVKTGIDRAALGVQILEAREDLPGYRAFGERAAWGNEGLKGALDNPVFGHGVEAFRFDIGITSHSTPIDLLYNSGLIGLCLFYGIFASLGWRLLKNGRAGGVNALFMGGLAAYGFVTLSGTMHYNVFLAAFFALCAAMIDDDRTDEAAGRVV